MVIMNNENSKIQHATIIRLLFVRSNNWSNRFAAVRSEIFYRERNRYVILNLSALFRQNQPSSDTASIYVYVESMETKKMKDQRKNQYTFKKK